MTNQQTLIDFIKANGGVFNVTIFDNRLRQTNMPASVTLKTIRAAAKAGLITMRRVVGTYSYDLAVSK